MPSTFAIDARAAAEVPAGRGRYVRELLRALAVLPEAQDARFALYARAPWHDPLLDERFSWRLISLPDPWWHLVAAVRMSRSSDAILSTNSYLTAWATTSPTAVVVHDLVPFVDGGHAQSRAALIEKVTIRPGLRRARALVCDSTSTRDDLVALFPGVAGKATAVPLAADPQFAHPGDSAAAAARYGLDRPYVMAAGTLEPRKNLERLVEAWGRLPADLRDGHLLALIGPTGWDVEPLLRLIDARPDQIRRLGFVPDDDLPALYSGCAAFVYPSLYEGFGLPVLEAMAAGAPVVTSTVSSLPEVAGDAGLLVDPYDVDAIAAAVTRILRDDTLADDLRARGRERFCAFSWERTARETLAVLRSIVGG